MSRTFKNIRLVFLLGIGGGVPSRRNPVHLGDVVVGITHDARGAVFEYDRGKERQSNTFEHTSSLNSPPVFAINIVRAIEMDLTLDPEQLDWKINEGLDNIPQRIRQNFSRPQSNPDNLYESLFTHPQQGEPNHCGELCSLSHVVLWHARQPQEIMATTHLGLIASGDRVIKDAIFRDKMAEKNVLCMEMEAAGVMNNAPCLVIRGISDYCDTHKNDQWHGYAAMSAAAYARMVLDKLHPSTIQAQDRLNQLLVSG
jgi:nucleoside phosphorylase